VYRKARLSTHIPVEAPRLTHLGVMLSNYNLVCQLYIPSVQARAHVAAAVAAGEPAPSPVRTIAHLPIAHIAGVFGYLISPIFSGGAVYWMQKFSWKPFLAHMKALRITVFYTVPSIFLRIAKSPDVTDQFDTVEVAITGAAKMDADLQQAANAKLGKGNTRISQTWGLSETTVSSDSPHPHLDPHVSKHRQPESRHDV
jgi:4-coumarate--CoA ligase